MADEASAKAKLAEEIKQLRNFNETLAGEVYFCRTYPDKVTARYRNGLLVITALRAEHARPRRVTVQAD